MPIWWNDPSVKTSDAVLYALATATGGDISRIGPRMLSMLQVADGKRKVPLCYYCAKRDATLICTGCKNGSYCSIECAKKARKQHVHCCMDPHDPVPKFVGADAEKTSSENLDVSEMMRLLKMPRPVTSVGADADGDVEMEDADGDRDAVIAMNTAIANAPEEERPTARELPDDELPITVVEPVVSVAPLVLE